LRLHSWKAKKFYNECHSESRSDCYKKDETVFTSILEYEHLTEKAHLLNGAPDCAVKVLNSSFINLSLFALFAILISIML
jgi:hypothetical protein